MCIYIYICLYINIYEYIDRYETLSFKFHVSYNLQANG